MSTTIVPPYDGLIVRRDVEELRDIVRGWLVEAQGNEDKASDVEDACYYEGEVSALTAVLEYLLGVAP